MIFTKHNINASKMKLKEPYVVKQVLYATTFLFYVNLPVVKHLRITFARKINFYVSIYLIVPPCFPFSGWISKVPQFLFPNITPLAHTLKHCRVLVWFTSCVWFSLVSLSEIYLEACQTSVMEFFCESI